MFRAYFCRGTLFLRYVVCVFMPSLFPATRVMFVVRLTVMKKEETIRMTNRQRSRSVRSGKLTEEIGYLTEDENIMRNLDCTNKVEIRLERTVCQLEVKDQSIQADKKILHRIRTVKIRRCYVRPLQK